MIHVWFWYWLIISSALKKLVAPFSHLYLHRECSKDMACVGAAVCVSSLP